MDEYTEKVADLAAMYAPFKYGYLGSRGKQGDFTGGRNPAVIGVMKKAYGGSPRQSHVVYLNTRYRNKEGKAYLYQYAEKINSGDFNKLGPGSIRKGKALGIGTTMSTYRPGVGPHFLLRALAQLMPKINAAFRDAMKRGLK